MSSVSVRLRTGLERVLRRLGWERFLLGDGPRAGPVTLTRSTVYVLPTREGVWFGGLLLLLLVGSYNYNNSLAMFGTFLLAGFAVLSILHTVRNLTGLTLRAESVESLFPGGRARFPVWVQSERGAVGRSVLFRAAQDPDRQVALEVPPAGVRVGLECPAERRGRLRLGRFTVESRHPAGLFRAWSHLDLDQQCWVYPHPGPRRPWPVALNGNAQGLGDSRGGAEDFTGLRGYRPGDPPRRIHWKASARGESLLVKEFTDGVPEELWLVWDQAAGSGVEERLGQLCRWVLDAREAGVAWGLRLPGVEVPPGIGDTHLRRCLTELARYEESV